MGSKCQRQHLRSRRLVLEARLFKNYVIFSADNQTLGGGTPILAFANFYCLYVPIMVTFKLPMGPACKNPE